MNDRLLSLVTTWLLPAAIVGPVLAAPRPHDWLGYVAAAGAVWLALVVHDVMGDVDRKHSDEDPAARSFDEMTHSAEYKAFAESMREEAARAR